ncbi:hypothetical protein ACQP1V_24210 [Microtetraspora malaysiensis]|uniref:hypothetical protein n=1 Tax=Microtetraspora malaysiensis TaxID=161358 RepID=UPI003D901D5A
MIGSRTTRADRARTGGAGISWAWAAFARTSSVRAAPRRTQTHRVRVGVAVTGGPVAMLPPMAGALMTGALARASKVTARPLVVTAGALVGMARTQLAGALPPTADALVQAALAVTARTPQARMLLVVIAG